MKATLLAIVVLGLSSAILGQSKVTKETIPGITNLARLETTVACAGAVTPAAVAEIKKMGFKAVFNLRLPTENGNDVEGEAAAAKAAGINFVNLPLSGSMPDAAVADKFLKAIAEPGNQPAFIHCASGNRASAMWFIKRVLLDKWEEDRAMAEASDLGAMSATMKTFALDYVKTHKK